MYNTFSFADYYDPARTNFGALRVINDGTLKGGAGFGAHPNNNMEIVSIPLYGALKHSDNLGHVGVVNPGEIQVLSAGSGIIHSIHNANKNQPVSFFQIWVVPREKDLNPKYDKKSFDLINSRNTLVQLISPDKENGSLHLNQDAWFSMGVFTKGHEFKYQLKKQGNGLYIIVIDGEFGISDETLQNRDGIGIFDTPDVSVKTLSDTGRILLIDVIMNPINN
jgi:redox-sensitive bicupin YhaK (pirin superfamily)